MSRRSTIESSIYVLRAVRDLADADAAYKEAAERRKDAAVRLKRVVRQELRKPRARFSVVNFSELQQSWSPSLYIAGRLADVVDAQTPGEAARAATEYVRQSDLEAARRQLHLFDSSL